MANKRKFFITKKFLAEFMGISRPTLDKRLSLNAVSIKDAESILFWIYKNYPKGE
jgi:hypothetical protein